MIKRANKKSWQKSEKMTEFEDRAPLPYFVKTVIPLLCMILILYGAAHLLIRTEGCRSLVAERLEEELGMPVKIGEMWPDASLNLHVQGVQSENGIHRAEPGFKVGHAVLRWSLLDGLREEGSWLQAVEVDNLQVSMVRDAEGQWQPEAFKDMAKWLKQWGQVDFSAPEAKGGGKGAGGRKSDDKTAAEKTGQADGDGNKGEKATAEAQGPSVWKSIPIVARDASIRWWDESGTMIAGAIGLDVDSTPLTVPGRDLHHYRISMKQAQTAGDQIIPDVRMEIVSTRDHHIILGFEADWRKAAQMGDAGGAVRDFSGIIASTRKSLREKRKEQKEEDPEVIRADAEELADYFRSMLEDALLTGSGSGE